MSEHLAYRLAPQEEHREREHARLSLTFLISPFNSTFTGRNGGGDDVDSDFIDQSN